MKRTIELLHQGIADGTHPGAQLYVSLEGQTIIDAALGVARDNVEMTPDTLTLWMSAGKPLAAAAALQLVERGAMKLDTPIAAVLPAFAAGGKSDITLRHLLTHTGGFRGPLNNFAPGTFDELVARACGLRQEPGWTPGMKAGYHVASSWFVLGAFIGTIDGRPFDQYVREAVFAPIGARDSSVGLTASEAAAYGTRLAWTYVTDETPPTHDFVGNTEPGIVVCRPGANARGPIRELARFYEALLAPDSGLLRPETIESMTARQRAGMFDNTFKEITDWGFGLKLDSKRYGAVGQYGYGAHASDDAFGHSGNQTACAFADPRRGLVAAWLCNGMPGEAAHQIRQHALNTALYEDLELA